ncbi:MAG: YkgJ family cysteine cluster protein, partial [Chthonomonadales bacterium]
KMEDGEKYMIRTPCEFLSGNKCSVYESRPKACRDFPYLHNSQFRQRMLTAIDNTEICPIAYNVMEILKLELEFPSKLK